MTTITLTFDNGPEPDVTPHVLDTLRRHDIRSTFFVVGEKLRERRHLAERAHADGHWIGNHTYTHRLPLGMNSEPGAAVAEIERTERLIGDLAHPRRLFRPFGNGGQLVPNHSGGVRECASDDERGSKRFRVETECNRGWADLLHFSGRKRRREFREPASGRYRIWIGPGCRGERVRRGKHLVG